MASSAAILKAGAAVFAVLVLSSLGQPAVATIACRDCALSCSSSCSGVSFATGPCNSVCIPSSQCLQDCRSTALRQCTDGCRSGCSRSCFSCNCDSICRDSCSSAVDSGCNRSCYPPPQPCQDCQSKYSQQCTASCTSFCGANCVSG